VLSVGPDTLATSAAPLADVVRGAGADWAVPVVSVGAAVGSLGVLLSLLVGVSRTSFAMAAERDLPGWLDAVHPVRAVPHRAELVVGLVVVVVVSVADLRGAIGFSSFAVLTYYAIANASAWTLAPDDRRWPRPVAALGLVGCIVVAMALPIGSVLGGAALLAVGVAVWALRQRMQRS
jgi:APA family basic amino acid/polyamine antiporter